MELLWKHLQKVKIIVPISGGRMVMNPIVQAVDKSREKNQAQQNTLDLETHEWGRSGHQTGSWFHSSNVFYPFTGHQTNTLQ